MQGSYPLGFTSRSLILRGAIARGFLFGDVTLRGLTERCLTSSGLTFRGLTARDLTFRVFHSLTSVHRGVVVEGFDCNKLFYL